MSTQARQRLRDKLARVDEASLSPEDKQKFYNLKALLSEDSDRPSAPNSLMPLVAMLVIMAVGIAVVFCRVLVRKQLPSVEELRDARNKKYSYYSGARYVYCVSCSQILWKP